MREYKEMFVCFLKPFEVWQTRSSEYEITGHLIDAQTVTGRSASTGQNGTTSLIFSWDISLQPVQ